jgi:hypothetical protein
VRRVVTVQLAGEPASVQAMEGVLRERLAPAELTLSFTRTEVIDPAAVVTPSGVRDDDLARIWIDDRARERVTLYLVDGKWERVLVRHFRRHENPEVVNEEVGHVVELALTALRGGERIGIGRDLARAQLAPEAPDPVPPPPATDEPPPPAPVPAPPSTTSHVRGGVFYEAQAYGAGPQLWSGPGLLVELRREREGARWSYGGLLSLQYRLPSTTDAADATVDFDGGAAHLLAMGATRISRPAELAFGVGPGIDLLHAEARGLRGADVRFAEGRVRWIPTVRALVRYEHAVQRLRIFAGVGLDVPFESTRYVLARGSENVVLFSAWGARPFVVLGIEGP